MDCTSKTIKIHKRKYFLWLSVIAAGLLCFCLRIGTSDSVAVSLNTHLPVEVQMTQVQQEVQDVMDFVPAPEIIVAPDIDQELLDLLRSSAMTEDLPIQHSPPVKTVKSTPWKTVRMRVTGYCACPKCCGKFSDGFTANMHRIRPGDVFVAADKKVPFGTRVIIPGYNRGRSVEVKDRGRLIRGNRLDLYFTSHKTAQKWGAKELNVRVRAED